MNFRDGIDQLRVDLKADIEKRLAEFYKEHGLTPYAIDVEFTEITHFASRHREWRLGDVSVKFSL